MKTVIGITLLIATTVQGGSFFSRESNPQAKIRIPTYIEPSYLYQNHEEYPLSVEVEINSTTVTFPRVFLHEGPPLYPSFVFEEGQTRFEYTATVPGLWSLFERNMMTGEDSTLAVTDGFCGSIIHAEPQLCTITCDSNFTGNVFGQTPNPSAGKECHDFTLICVKQDSVSYVTEDDLVWRYCSFDSSRNFGVEARVFFVDTDKKRSTFACRREEFGQISVTNWHGEVSVGEFVGVQQTGKSGEVFVLLNSPYIKKGDNSFEIFATPARSRFVPFCGEVFVTPTLGGLLNPEIVLPCSVEWVKALDR